MRRPPVAALVVGLLLAALVGVGQLAPARGPRATATGTSVPVVGATVLCPDLRQAGSVLRTRVSVGVVPGVGLGGSADARALAGTGASVPLAVRGPGQVAVGLAQQLDGDALLVQARGPLAGGLEVEQVTRGTSGSQRGLAALRCAAAGTDAWFVGGATTVGEAAVLLLANPDDTPTVVDVDVLTATGPADGRAGQGVVVGPHARTAVRLEDLAPDRDLLAVHVTSVRGRFAAGVRHVRFDGRTPRGVDWVPPAGRPARSVVVAGLPAGPGRRTVVVANPGEDDTTVSLQLTTGQGQVGGADVPALAAVPVPGRSSVAVDLSDRLATTPAAVRVVSEAGPVLAAGFVLDAQFSRGRPVGQVRELAWAGAAAPLRGPALLTDVVLDRPTESTLLLSAPDTDASVTVTPLPVVGRSARLPAARTVAVPAGRTVAVPLSSFLPRGTVGRLAVEVRPAPGSGPVYAARYLRERGATGPLSTDLVLQSASALVRRPAVREDPAAGVLGG